VGHSLARGGRSVRYVANRESPGGRHRQAELAFAGVGALLASGIFAQSTRSSRRLRQPWSSRVACSRRSLLDDLQGSWEDDVGNEIEVSGDLAKFSDGSGTWKIESAGESLRLRGTQLIGTADRPLWRFSNGIVRSWKRPLSLAEHDSDWKDVFFRYKEELLQIRRQMWASISMEDFAEASVLRDSWNAGGSFPRECTLEQQARLAAGRRLVPGVCFVHRRFKYRGVVLACEPWCTAPGAWRRMMDVASLPRGETQPFYHCCVDDRDRPAGQITFVSEENIEPTDAAFPVQTHIADLFLVPCKELGGYLPGPRLERLLRNQRAKGKFTWEIDDEGDEA